MVDKKSLIEYLHKFGFTCSFFQLILSHTSAAACTANRQTTNIIGHHMQTFVQVVNNNFDFAISSFNWKKTNSFTSVTHVQPNNGHSNNIVQETMEIPRLHRKIWKTLIYYLLNIYHNLEPKKPTVSNIKSLSNIPKLEILVIDVAAYYDLRKLPSL